MTVGELGRVYIDWASKHQGSVINMKAVPAASAAMSEMFNCTTRVMKYVMIGFLVAVWPWPTAYC